MCWVGLYISQFADRETNTNWSGSGIYSRFKYKNVSYGATSKILLFTSWAARMSTTFCGSAENDWVTEKIYMLEIDPAYRGLCFISMAPWLPPTGRPMRRESKLYSQTQSSRELDTDQVEARWIYQRYGRSSTLDNIDPSSAAAGFSERFGSPLSDDEQPPFGILTSATGHIRVPQSQQQSEYSIPVPTVPRSSVSSVPSWEAIVMNPIVPQLSTVLVNGPLIVETESSPRPVRAADN